VVRSLSFHRSYGCRHSGACCTAGWPIAVEADQLLQIRTAMAAGALTADQDGDANFVWPEDREPAAPVLLAAAAGRCVFHDAAACRCRIQRALGHAALPLACRQFPRVTVIDPRGTSVTLSHYCPTAARLLDEDGAVTIDTDPPAFPPDGEYAGLDTRQALPPLLRPDMLMDWDSWWEWERLSVETLATLPAGRARVQLAGAVEMARTWQPGEGRLVDRVRAAFAAASRTGTDRTRMPPSSDLIREVLDAIPHEHRLAGIATPAPPPSAGALPRFLAAHAFANWTAHFGQGLRTWLRSIDAAHALATNAGVRQADLLLRHLADPAALAKGWEGIERD